MRPIIFSAEMVRAILEGRKTQTRRVIKHSHAYIDYPHKVTTAVNWLTKHCPYGQPGDILWVRETHYRWTGCNNPPSGWVMVDDNPYNARAYLDNAEAEVLYKQAAAAVKVSAIHMPRWAARIFLKVTSIRVERLQDISEEDAKAEAPQYAFDAVCSIAIARDILDLEAGYYKSRFALLWDKLYSKRGLGWKVNPWVWVIEFEKVSC